MIEDDTAYALIAGASTTIGAEFARQLAGRGYALVLVARRHSLLEALAEEIRGVSDVAVRIVVMDLLSEGAVERLSEETRGLRIDFLVCNANLHKAGLFREMDLETKLRMIRMNSELPVRLVDSYARSMAERRCGQIVLVGALNCLSAIDIDSVFQGTKGFLLVFGESLWAEYRRYDVQVGVALVSGIEGSESYEAKLSPKSRRFVKLLGASMPPARIVSQSLSKLERGKPLLIPDFVFPINHIGYWLLVAVRATLSRSATLGLASVFRWLLDGDEVQAQAPESR